MNDADLISEVQRKLEEAQGHHDTFVRLFERRERAYHGIKENTRRKSKWRHDLRPRYAFNLLETVVASQIEMGLKLQARPSPMASMEPEQAAAQLAIAEDVEYLLAHEHRVDRFDSKQRGIFLCDGIGGRGIGKTYWNYVPGMTHRQGMENVPVEDDMGNVVGHSPTIVEIHEEGIVRDHSTTEVVDPRDFILHESARSLDPRAPGGAQHLFHRCWYSYEQLLWLQQMGFVQNVEQLKDSTDYQSEYRDREKEIFDINFAKDLIEVLEYWCFKNGKIYTSWVGNRRVVLKPERDNPFWHDGYPFFICSSMPQPFSLNGTSTIELIEALQEIIWELSNQRLDNVELINNAIMLIRGDVEDPDAFEYYPGARWEVDDVSQVQALMPPYQVAEVSLQAEALLKGDLQNVTSAAPFAGGAQTASVEQTTATGASIVMNAAQQQLAMKKYQAQFGLQEEAWQRLKNCQQFIDGERLVHILGPEGRMAFKRVSALAIQGEFVVELAPMGESMMRQERRAEATTFTQVIMGFAPLMAAGGTPLDLKEVIKWYAKMWDIPAPDRFFSAQQAQPAVAAQGQGGGQNGSGGPQAPPGAPAGPNLGITSSSAVDASSPSSSGGFGMNPVTMLKRAQNLANAPAGGNA